MVNETANQTVEACEATIGVLYTFYASAMIVIFILALPLNASVLHLFIFKLKFWKTNPSNVFLFNLLLADILLLFCLPFKASTFINGERRSRNEAACKAVLFVLFLNRAASIAFLTVISIDRYYNVVKAGQKNLLKMLKKSPYISIFIWLLLLPLTTPTMLKDFDCCSSFSEGTLVEDVVDILREIVFFSQIVVPFVILVYCTVCIVNRLRRKGVGNRTKVRRAVLLVTIVMVVFSLCFLPCAIARMVLLVVSDQKLNESVLDKAAEAFDGLVVLSYVDCLLDPLVYCFGSTKFKELYISTYFPCLMKGTQTQKERTSDNVALNTRKQVEKRM
ncbi:12-(S)-hydroxy-5,8,10,14-eicosatetraenoic acid receptor [Nothobranchius furzeri]|uniref:14-eicosatetraenoic acid receptor-like n=2 Tax=Nothobranchius furzeri TaxID=105023 RepID=A0A9D3C2S3_NOTFU|nr:12-(S)-hydroxy-5,8,10,14-eicosatetraenoic acid receptor [Nothobranchius furzeri]KAF7230981.1 14-eicosatetraenoic acid receptor-like [Nothobranchius furzeri]